MANDPTDATQQMAELVKTHNIQHVALIMDGNRRWAKERFLPAIVGHQQGVNSLEKAVAFASDIGLKALTVYAFSTENWQRPQEEVSGLMDLFVIAIRQQIKGLKANHVRLRFIGDLSRLPAKVKAVLDEAEAETANESGLQFQVATNYGSRLEITQAVQQLCQDVKAGRLSPEEITEQHISQTLYTRGLPDPDILIRTGGESRLSNYLLWQCAYTEFYVSQTLWPAFTPQEFGDILHNIIQRERRFGR